MPLKLIENNPGSFVDMPDDAYYRNHAWVSTSDLKLAKSNPRAYRRLIETGERKPPTKEMKLGSDVDAIAMHPCGFGYGVAIGERQLATSARRNKSTEKRILLDSDPIAQMLVALSDDAEAMGYLTAKGSTQVAIEFRSVFEWDDGRQFSLNRRAKLDRLIDTGKGSKGLFSAIVDLKTSRVVDPELFSPHALSLGWHIQAAAYQDAVESVCGERPPVVLVVVQNCDPFATACYELDDAFMELGRRALDRLVENFVRMRDTATWRSATFNKTTLLAPPAWAERALNEWSA